MRRGRPPGSRGIPWERIVAELRKHPGKWILFSEMSSVPERTIATIRRRERRALRLEDGVIRCRRKATAWLEDGRVMCTLILKFDERKT